MALQVVQAPEPPWVRIARGELGVREVAGAPNERVNEYLASVGAPPGSDWCAGFACFSLEKAGLASPRNPAARSFLKWGEAIVRPVPGCVVVLWRVAKDDWRGHLGFFISESAQKIRMLSGNSGKQVRISNYPKARLLGYRWPSGVG